MISCVASHLNQHYENYMLIGRKKYSYHLLNQQSIVYDEKIVWCKFVMHHFQSLMIDWNI